MSNDRRSQEKLFRLYFGKMLAVCVRYIPDRDSAQDAVHEAFIKVFEKINVFDFKGSFDGWIRRIVVNTAIDKIRKSKNDPFRTDNENDFKLGAEDPIVEKEELDILEIKAEIAMDAIGKLSPSYRAVFNLFVIEDFSHKEIAEKLGISEGTSKSNLSKAKLKLQSLLAHKFVNF